MSASLAGPPTLSAADRPTAARASLAGLAAAVLPPALPISALLIWLLSLVRLDLTSIGDYGLVPLLPFTYYLALGLVVIGFCAALHEPRLSQPLLLLHAIVLILIVHGTAPLVYELPRYAWTYKHVGAVEYFMRNAATNPGLDPFHVVDIYQSWPGFFLANAALLKLVGGQSALAYAGWAPVVFNFAFMLALLFVYRALTSDRRLVWFAVWLFLLTNWVGQDYFAPQPFAFFLHLVVLGIYLTWFRAEVPEERTRLGQALGRLQTDANHWVQSRVRPSPLHGFSDLARLPLMAAILVIFAAITASHPLTPFMLIASVGALVLFGVCRWRALPVVLALIAVAWLVLFAQPYIVARSDVIFASIGRIFENAFRNVSALSGATPGRAFVALTARALTLTVSALAIAGAILRVRRGYRDVAALLLWFAPYPLLAMQAYGGEMLFRVLLFSLPFQVFFAATLLYPTRADGRGWRTGLAATAVSFGLLLAFVFAYFGNERVNYLRVQDMDAAEWVYGNVPDGSLVLVGTFNGPWQYRDQGRLRSTALTEMPWIRSGRFGPVDVAKLEDYLETKRYPAAYVLITRSQKEQDALMGAYPRGAFAQLEQELTRSPSFGVVYQNADARVFRFVGPEVRR